MSRICTILMAALILALVCASICRAQLVVVPAKTKEGPLPTVKGIVVDSKGKPIRKAQVFALIPLTYASSDKPITEKVPVDSKGRFTF